MMYNLFLILTKIHDFLLLQFTHLQKVKNSSESEPPSLGCLFLGKLLATGKEK